MEDVKVERSVEGLDDFISEAIRFARTSFSLQMLTSHSLVRAYRDFFWKIGIDPTKTRPSAEALMRRVLQGRDFPRVNVLVDVYNVVSMKKLVPIAAFDADKISENLLMRFARNGEEFFGIGMERPMILKGKEVVVEDGEKLVAVYPYRDAETSKVTEMTGKTLFMVCGVPGVAADYLKETSTELVEAVRKFCGGHLTFEKSFTT
ncbi:MAG: phenylalanine--tRNA ligase beta subunit-related protein [Candidatus Caldarchaeum sp.]|nr:phenylalanine--tRNA ligase beta subunit-related protein [Candidatus Caldarchaeum sp.]MCX8201825.1 phenylalanine--tRNA ligase beta subunit-related protein [Candidatus Caldarchaeum sp.]MDW8062554.1 phenylalanine--tRNA ligase beta subunit-related protein [Candidatus Caldarchaeum sp.]MDW8436050.1 phenylalanine--tRNA ligase beta subunit-related protein [Candidatus Caldarchaeum sp.]